MKNVETIQLKVKLNRIKPDIWRRVIVDSSYTLHQLHETIQIAMGWYNCHLYEFNVQGEIYGIPDEEDNFLAYEVEDSRKIKIDALGLALKDKIKYVYDLGDDWAHTIIFEKILKIGEVEYPVCLAGARNCPPEDCGSVPGYEEIVEAMKKPKSKEAKEFIDWLGGPYDSEEFDIERINARLKTIKKEKKKDGRGRKKEIGSAKSN
jgi:hypothetical protein